MGMWLGRVDGFVRRRGRMNSIQSTDSIPILGFTHCMHITASGIGFGMTFLGVLICSVFQRHCILRDDGGFDCLFCSVPLWDGILEHSLSEEQAFTYYITQRKYTNCLLIINHIT